MEVLCQNGLEMEARRSKVPETEGRRRKVPRMEVLRRRVLCGGGGPLYPHIADGLQPRAAPQGKQPAEGPARPAAAAEGRPGLPRHRGVRAE